MHTPEKIAGYIKREPAHAKKALKQMQALVRKLVPRATEKLAWGMPTFYLEGNLLHYAAFKNHMSLFPGTDAVERFKPELSRYQTSKGTIQIPYGDSIPAALIGRIVKFCVKRNLARAQSKNRTKAKKSVKATRNRA